MDTKNVCSSPLQKDLPQIDAPQPAIAEANQRKHIKIYSPPRGVVTRLLPSTPTAHPIPHEQAANWFKETFDGYMHAQFPSYAKYPTDPVKMLHAERLELELASQPHDQIASRPLDQSLPPRKVSVWLMGWYGEQNSQFLDVLLDSFARWSNFKVDGRKIVNLVRMNAVFDTDATYIIDAIRHELVEQPPASFLMTGQAMLLVRWCTQHGMRSAFRKIESCQNSSSKEYIMRQIQDCTVVLTGCNDIPLPRECMVPMPCDAYTPNEFYLTLCQVASDFFDLLVGIPSITISQETKDKKASRILQPTGCIVRVCDRKLGHEGIHHTSCFHGAILCIANQRKEATIFLEQSDMEGIRPPISQSERALGLHLCAVQAERMCLGPLVTLFGTTGVSGNPIHSPGSWVWVARPAVRPIQSDLLNVFSLHPCSRTSLLPRKPELIPAFERFWKHTTLIYKMIEDGELNHSSFLSKQRSRSPSPTNVYEIEIGENDAAALRLLQLDMQSKRTTLGDAYAQLCMIPSARAIAENIVQAMAGLPNGVRASLSDMFEYNAKLLRQRTDQTSAKRKSAEALVILSEVALDIASDASRDKVQKINPKICIAPEVIRRYLKVLSIKGADHVTIDFGVGEIDQFQPIIQNIITTSIQKDLPDRLSVVLPLMKRSLKAIFDHENDNTQRTTDMESKGWLGKVEHALAMASSVAMVAMQALDISMFFIIGTCKENEVCVKSVELNGSLSPSSLDAMCHVEKPKVVILQQLSQTRVRITGTCNA